MKDPMSLRLGKLAGPVEAAAAAESITVSEWLRIAASEKLGVETPEAVVGNPNAGKQAKAAANARWGKRKPAKNRKRKS
jgi:hypothetical protein